MSHKHAAVLKGISSLLILVGVALATPLLWRLPFQMEQGGEVIGPIIFAGVPIALLASLFGVISAITAIRKHSTTK